MKQLVKKFLKKIHNKIRKIIKYMGNLVSGREVSADGVMESPPQGVIGMETSIGGDQISGKWINTQTGQIVYARQLIDNGGEAIVVTDIGPIPMSQFVQFVQMDEKEYVNKDAQPLQTSFGENLQLSDEDNKLLAGLTKPTQPSLPSLDKPLSQQTSQQYQSSTIQVETESPNYKMIDKLFKKFNTLKVKVDIDWNDFPKDKLETLIDIFDVPKNEIADYIIKNYLSTELLSNIISENI